MGTWHISHKAKHHVKNKNKDQILHVFGHDKLHRVANADLTASIANLFVARSNILCLLQTERNHFSSASNQDIKDKIQCLYAIFNYLSETHSCWLIVQFGSEKKVIVACVHTRKLESECVKYWHANLL